MPKRVTMHPVESSHIESVGHSSEGDLIVKYKGSPIHYAHPGISAAGFEKIKGSESVGKAVRALGKGKVWEPPKEK